MQSVLEQDVFFPFEYIIMDGGSTDGTLEILRKFNERIKLYSGKDDGQSDALNKGISVAGGDIIGWLNSDDIYLPGALNLVYDFFRKHPSCKWAYGKCRIIDDNDHEIRKGITTYKNLLAKRFNYSILLLENFISQPAVFFRRSEFEQTGPLKLDLPLAMDYDLWIRMAKRSKPGFIDAYLACIRIHGQSKSSKNIRKQFYEQYRIHKSHEHGKILLFLHRINIFKAISGYWILGFIKRLFVK